MDEIIELCESEGLSEEVVEKFLAGSGLSRAAFFDEFACRVANQYHSYERDFDFCDTAMNRLYAFSQFNLPSFAWSVFLAFDEGEFVHRGDSENDEPAELYTRPYIKQILAEDDRVQR